MYLAVAYAILKVSQTKGQNMNDTLNIYNFSGFGVVMEDGSMTIKGVQLADILNEYSTDEIVDALVAADKDADVIGELAKRSVEE